MYTQTPSTIKENGPFKVLQQRRQITKLFKHKNKSILSYTKHNKKHYITHTHTHKYNNSRMYHMKCQDCPLKYISQSGRTFNIRYKEHIHTITKNNSNSGYSNHILNTGHAYGTITNTMTGRKGRHLNT